MVTSGNIDSMVAHYTAAKRLRHDDAYTAGGIAGKRPDRAVIVYSNIIKRIYPDCPVIIGGLEAYFADLLIMIIGMTESDRYSY